MRPYWDRGWLMALGIDGVLLLDISERVAELMKPFKDRAIPVKVIAEASDVGLFYPGITVSGITHRGNIFLVQEGLHSIAEVTALFN
jgi:hypothetical protein